MTDMTDPSHGLLALKLHEIWSNADLRRDVVDILRADQSPAVRDQADATCREIAEAAEGTAAILLTDAPEWLALTITRELVAWVAGVAATCEHRPDVARPAPVFAASWRPELVVCIRCTTELEPDPPPHCALCGAADAARRNVVLAGPVVYTAASCAGCDPTSGGGTPLGPREPRSGSEQPEAR